MKLIASITTPGQAPSAGTRFTQVVKLGWQEVVNDTGAGSVTFWMTDPQLSLVVSHRTFIHCFRSEDEYDTGIPAFTLIPQTWDSVVVAPLGVAEQITWTCLGIGAYADRGILHPALSLGSHPIEEERGFDWGAAIYPWVAKGATAPENLGTVATTAGWDPEAEFGDPGAQVLGPAGSTTLDAPVGFWYPQQAYTIDTDGDYQIQILLDNYGIVHHDGAQIATPGQTDADNPGSGFIKPVKVNAYLTAGLHSISAEVYNAGGPTGFAFAVGTADEDGNFATLIAESDNSIAVSIDYPSEPPGLNPAEATLLFLGECQNGVALNPGSRGSLTDLDTSAFTGLVDANSDSWPQDILSAAKIGTSLLDFLRELSQVYIDWKITMDAAGAIKLFLYIIGGMTNVSGVDFHRATDPGDRTSGNLTQHRERGEG